MNEPLKSIFSGLLAVGLAAPAFGAPNASPAAGAPKSAPAPALHSIPAVKVGSLSPHLAPPAMALAPAPPPAAVDPWAWTKTQLNGNNAPYAKARAQIDDAISDGRSIGDLLAKYRAAAQAAPGDPLMLFRWAYVAYDAAAVDPSPANLREATAGLSDARYAVEPVTAYDFNRVRFLIATLTGPAPQLADMGRRLLDANPDDPVVEYAQAGILLDNFNPPKTLEALGLAEDLIRAEPGRAEPYALVGQVYYYRWKAHGQSADGIQARDAYRKYAQLASDDDSFKSRASSLADAIDAKLAGAGVSTATPAPVPARKPN